MEKDILNQFFQALQDAFLERRYDEVQRFFTLPLVIYTVAGVTLVRSTEKLVRITRQYREVLDDMGVESSSVEIAFHDAPKNQRMRATVTFTDYDADGTPVTGSVVRYFLVERDGAFRVEMMEYLQEPVSAHVVEQIVH